MSEIHPSKPVVSRNRAKHRLLQLKNMWPLLIWLGVLATAVVGYHHGNIFNRMNGVVEAFQHEVVAEEDGILVSWSPAIKPGARVKKGQVIGHLDSSLIEKEILHLESEIQREEYERIADENERLAEMTQSLWDLERENGAIQAQLKTLEDFKIGAGFVRERMEIALEISKLKGESTAIKEGLVAQQELVTRQQEMVTQLQNAELSIGSSADRAELELLKTRLSRMELRATIDGTIDRILKQPGQFAPKGEPLIQMVSSDAQILAFLPPDQWQQANILLAENRPVWVTASTSSKEAFETRLIDFAPRIDNIWDSTSPVASQNIRGRRVLIAYPPDCGLIPGQTVIVHLRPPGEIALLSSLFVTSESSNP